MNIDILVLTLFTVNGLIGGLLHLIVSTKKLEDLKQYQNWKVLIIGAIIGYMYYFLHSDYNFPNGVMSIVAGYMGQDFIVKIIEKLSILRGG